MLSVCWTVTNAGSSIPPGPLVLGPEGWAGALELPIPSPAALLSLPVLLLDV